MYAGDCYTAPGITERERQKREAKERGKRERQKRGAKERERERILSPIVRQLQHYRLAGKTKKIVSICHKI
jgi:hypothetical protein